VADLLDVKVLVALLVPEHQYHAEGLSWFSSEAATRGWATCTVTELGVIRVCAQLPGGKWPPEATADRLLLLTISSRGYVWWPAIVSPAVMPEVRCLFVVGALTLQIPKRVFDLPPRIERHRHER